MRLEERSEGHFGSDPRKPGALLPNRTTRRGAFFYCSKHRGQLRTLHSLSKDRPWDRDPHPLLAARTESLSYLQHHGLHTPGILIPQAAEASCDQLALNKRYLFIFRKRLGELPDLRGRLREQYRQVPENRLPYARIRIGRQLYNLLDGCLCRVRMLGQQVKLDDRRLPQRIPLVAHIVFAKGYRDFPEGLFVGLRKR